MAELLTDQGALDEYMGVWFRSEVPDTVEIRSTTVIFCKQLEERIESRRRVIDHLEKVRGRPTYGWLKRLKENHAEDLEQLEILNVLVARTYASVLVLLVVTAIVELSFTTGSISVAISVLPLPFVVDSLSDFWTDMVETIVSVVCSMMSCSGVSA
ncbi:hypothetical protein Tco_0375438 [Tanacetum coccineum]